MEAPPFHCPNPAVFTERDGKLDRQTVDLRFTVCARQGSGEKKIGNRSRLQSIPDSKFPIPSSLLLALQREFRRVRRRLRSIPAFDILVVFRNDAGNRSHNVAAVEVHQLHALRVAARHAHLRHG